MLFLRSTYRLTRIGIFALRPEKMLADNMLLYPENMEYDVNNSADIHFEKLLQLSEYKVLYFHS